VLLLDRLDRLGLVGQRVVEAERGGGHPDRAVARETERVRPYLILR
jgi:hypothetical protein